MGNWDPFDPVTSRTAFFEVIKQGATRLIRWLPFYQVDYPGLHGRAFEPVDCLKRKQMGGAATNSSECALKEIHEMRELDDKARIFAEELRVDSNILQLHAFGGCEWPR